MLAPWETSPRSSAAEQGAVPGYQTGQYYTGPFNLVAGAGTGLGVLNRATYIPLPIWNRAETFDRIATFVNTNGAAGAVSRLGIYRNNDGVPGTVLLDAGVVAADAGAPVLTAITINQTLTPGFYWLVCVPQVAGVAVYQRVGQSNMSGYLSSTFNTSVFITDGIAGALPDNPAVQVAAPGIMTVTLRSA